MWVVDKVRSILNRASASPSQLWPMRAPYQNTQAGTMVTPDEALTIVAIFRCVDFLSKSLSKLPVNVRRQVDENRSKLAYAHPVWRLMNKAVNNEMTAYQFRQVMWMSTFVYGSGYAEIERDMAGRPMALHYITPERVAPQRNRDTGALEYQISGGLFGDTAVLSPPEVLHFRANSGYDGILPYSLVAYAAKSLGVSLALEDFAASFFGNGAYPGGVLQHPKRLSPEGRKRTLAAWDDILRGPKRSKKTMLLEEGVTWASMQLDNDKSQFIESRKHQILECCRIFGVPPNKVYVWDKMSYNSHEQTNREFTNDSLVPYCTASEQEIDFKLLNNSYGGLFSKYDLRNLVRGSLEDRAKYYEVMSNKGAMSINEIRAMEDLNPIPNGDVHLVAANNMAPLDMVVSGQVGLGANPPAANDSPKDDEPEKKDDEEVTNTSLKDIIAEAASLVQPIATVETVGSLEEPPLSEEEAQLISASTRVLEVVAESMRHERDD